MIVSAGGVMCSAQRAFRRTQRADDGFLPRPCAPLHNRHGSGGRHPTREQRLRQFGQMGHAHQNHLRAGNAGNLIKVQRACGFVVALVAGEHGEVGGVVAMRERDARVIRRGRDGRHARHDLEGNFGLHQRLRLLAPATEDVGIATFEPHDAFARARLGDHQCVELFLGNVLSFAARNQFAARAGVPEQCRVDQQIVNDHVGALQQIRAAQREQSRIARARAHQIYRASFRHRREGSGAATKWKG